MAGTGRFALFVMAATTRITSPGATESGIPSTVNATANPVTCTSFVTVLLKVGVRMPTALAASRTATKKAARGPILIPSRIDHTSPAPPGRAFSTGPSRRDKEGSCMHRARRRIRAEAVTLFEGLGCPMPMKLAVLGARGLLGGAVARRARLAGHQVRAVVRPGPGLARVPHGDRGRRRGPKLPGICPRGGPRHGGGRTRSDGPVSRVAAVRPALRGQRTRGRGSRGRDFGVPRQRVRLRPSSLPVRRGRPSPGAAYRERTDPVGRGTKVPPGPPGWTRRSRPPEVPGRLRPWSDARRLSTRVRGRVGQQTVPLASEC